MAMKQPLDQAAENEDIEEVLSTLDGVAARAAAGAVVGMMIILRDSNGSNLCASAGWYGRNPDQGLLPAMAGLVQMCAPSDGSPPVLDRALVAPSLLH